MESVVGRLAAVVLPYARRAGHRELQAVGIGHLGCQFAQAIEYSRCRRLPVLILYTSYGTYAAGRGCGHRDRSVSAMAPPRRGLRGVHCATLAAAWENVSRGYQLGLPQALTLLVIEGHA